MKSSTQIVIILLIVGLVLVPVPASLADNRQESSLTISENAQGAHLLRELLLGKQFQIFGRVEGDIASYRIPSIEDEDGAEIRRLRIGIAGLNRRFENLSYKLEFDLADGTSSISDAYITMDFGARGELTIGNQDGTQSLSASTGSLSQLFMESPLTVEAFSLDKRIGISYDLNREHSGGHLLVFGRDLNSDAKHQGVMGRVYFNPHRSRAGIWHVGASVMYENISDATRLDSRPESHLTDARFVDTGWLEDVKTDSRLGFELAGATGSFTTRLELMLNNWKRDNGSHNRFRGAYLEGGYFITGEPFRYRNGKFVRPRLQDSNGALELGYRLSWIDLNDGDVFGGEQRNAGLALNYYPRPDLRGQLNLIHVNSDREDSDGLLVQLRLQFNW